MAETFFHDLRASADQGHFVASVDHRLVSVWNAVTLQKEAAVEPGFNGGRQRLGLEPVKRWIYSGTWEDGISCYDYGIDRLLWHRSDLFGIQRLDLSNAFPSSLFVALEIPDHRVDEANRIDGIVELDAATGDTKWHSKDGHRMYVHPSRPIIVVEDRLEGQVHLLNGSKKVIGSVPMTYFALVDVAFSGSLVGLAEGKEGVRILNCDAEVVCSYIPPGREPNCIRISLAEDGTAAFQDSWDATYIALLDTLSGKLLHEYQRESAADICFIENGRRFIDSWGEICRTSDGTLEANIRA